MIKQAGSTLKSPVMMEIEGEPTDLTETRDKHGRFDRNLKWFETHAAELGETYRGKFYCVAGEALFVADTAREAFLMARAAHPDDDGLFTGYVPRTSAIRIYANPG
jgi:hypothetical protein